MQIKHVFFDNDGTLVDSEIIAMRTILYRLEPHGFTMDVDTYAQKFPGLLERDILAIIQRDYGITVPHDFLERLHHDHILVFEEQLEIIAGMDEVFRSVKTDKSMVSNASVLHVERCLHLVGLSAHFDGPIFSANHVEKPKPAPDVYLYAMQQTQTLAHEIIAIEDSPTGVLAAKAAGLKVIGFLGASHITPGHEVQLLEAGADYLAESAVELKALLGGMGVL